MRKGWLASCVQVVTREDIVWSCDFCNELSSTINSLRMQWGVVLSMLPTMVLRCSSQCYGYMCDVWILSTIATPPHFGPSGQGLALACSSVEILQTLLFNLFLFRSWLPFYHCHLLHPPDPCPGPLHPRRALHRPQLQHLRRCQFHHCAPPPASSPDRLVQSWEIQLSESKKCRLRESESFCSSSCWFSWMAKAKLRITVYWI